MHKSTNPPKRMNKHTIVQQSPQLPATASYDTIVSIIAIVVVGLLAYSNTYSVPFQFDDNKFIVNSAFTAHIHSTSDVSLSRLIGHVTFALNYKLHALNVTGYHVINTIIHLINALLVYWLLAATFKIPSTFERIQQGMVGESSPVRWIPLFSAMIFVAHPVHTQAVTYIVQRFSSLATLFYLLSVTAYVQSKIDPLSKKARYSWYSVSISAAVCAMFTKEISFTLPVIIICYDLIFFRTSIQKRIFEFIPFILILPIIPVCTLKSAGLTYNASGLNQLSESIGYGISRWDYLTTQFRVIVTYIRLMLFPVRQNLDYDYPIYRSMLDTEILLSLALLIMIMMTGVFVMIKSNSAPENERCLFKCIAFGILWFFITLAVESSVFPIEDVIFEHRLYLPSIGLIISFATGMALALEHLKIPSPVRKFLYCSFMVSALLVLAVMTYSRNNIWRSESSLWQDVTEKSPGKARGHYNLGLAYQKQGRIPDAIKSYQKAVSIKSDYVDAIYNLATCYYSLGNITDALNANQVAITLRPDYAPLHYSMGILYSTQGKYNEAIASYQSAIKLNPDYTESYNDLGRALTNQGRYDDAIAAYQQAKRLQPDYVAAMYNLGVLYQHLKRYKEAITEFQHVLQLNPTNIEVRNRISILRGNIR